MNDRELESRLRTRYRARARETETAPQSLRRDVAAIARSATSRRRLFGRGRGVTLLAAAALLLVGGAITAGSGLLRWPAVVPPLPAPSLAAVVSPSPVAPSPSPSDLARPSASPVSVEGPGGTWIRTGSMINPGDGNLVRLLDGRVLAMGGESSDGAGGQTAELYDPVTGTWSATGSPIRDVRFAPATLLPDGRVLAGFPDVAELYDPASGAWTATGTSPNGGAYLASSALLRNGKVLVVFNGSTPEHQGLAALYDPASGTWTATSKSPTATLYDSTAVALSDGRVLVAGGAAPCERCSIKSAALYDPQTDTWADTADMPWPGSHDLGRLEATVLQDGTVLFYILDAIIGSERGGGVALYDPSTGTWTVVENPPNGTKAARLTRLLDGRVLMTGLDGAPEIYDPATRSWTKAASMLPISGGGYPESQATLLLDGTVLFTDRSGAQLYVPAGVTPPTGLAPVPDPTPTPTPTPTPPGPTPLPPMTGPVPQGARPWTVKVINERSVPATFALADSNGQLCGSVTPNVVPPNTTENLTFELPPKSVECWIHINPGPGDLSGVGWETNNKPMPGYFWLTDGEGGPTGGGQNGWVSQ